MHHLLRMAGERLADRDDAAVVEGARDGKVVVDDLRDGHADRGQEDPLRGLAEPRVLLRRLADHDRRIDRIAAHGQRRQVEDGEPLGRRVVAGVVAERPLVGQLVLRDVALEDDLRVRGHVDCDRLRADELDRLAAEEAGEHQLVDVLRQRGARGVRRDRIRAERDGDLDLPVRREIVGAAVLVDLPVHRRRARPELLHAVHADVTHAGARIVGDHGRKRDERRGVIRPALLDRQQVERRGVALEHDLLARRAANRLRPRVRDRLQLLQAAHLLDEPLRRLHLEHVAELLGDRVERRRIERHRHPPLRSELVDQQRPVGALDVLEEQRRPAALDDAVVDLRDLELGIDLGGDAHELALALEQGDPLAQVTRRSHRRSVYGGERSLRQRAHAGGEASGGGAAPNAASARSRSR